MKMRYIENFELREWVKDSLRKAIFHKAHALAVQTGCEILVKLQDDGDDVNKGCYYATNHLEYTYNNTGLRRLPGELSISGDTGLPIIATVEKGIQSQDASNDTQTERTASTSDAATGQIENDMVTEESSQHRTTEVNSEQVAPVPVALDSRLGADPLSETFLPNETTLNVKSEVDDAIVAVKLEATEVEDETGLLEMTSELIGTEEMQVGDVLSQTFSTNQSQDFPMVPMSPKPYQCGMCHKAFRSIQVLQKHTQTFHMRPQNIALSRSRGRGGLKQRQSHVPFATQEQRYQCTMCSRNFRHPALLDDHMNRSHMGIGARFPSTSNSGQSSTSALEQLSQSLPLHLGTDNSSPMDAVTDPVLPKITSVSSLQHLAPTPSGPLTTSASTSSAPFAQGSPMGPVFRHQAPTASPRTPQSRPPGSANRAKPSYMKISVPYLKSALLKTPGPICTYSSVTQSGPQILRTISKQDFMQACLSLKSDNLIEVVNMNSPTGELRPVLVKKPPASVRHILIENSALCTGAEYTNRYEFPVPIKVISSIRKKLVELGYVTEKQVEYRYGKKAKPNKHKGVLYNLPE